MMYTLKKEVFIMCGRYGFTSGSKVKERYGIKGDVEDFDPRYNIAPSYDVPIIIVGKSGEKIVVKMKWGFIPRWSKDPKMAQINARAEGIEQKAFFRASFKDRRCLVPANFFYEWLKLKEDKIPYLIRPTDQDLFAFAGLYDVVKDAEGKPFVTFAIITTEPNEIVAKIHNRMPVILTKIEEEEWLDP